MRHRPSDGRGRRVCVTRRFGFALVYHLASLQQVHHQHRAGAPASHCYSTRWVAPCSACKQDFDFVGFSRICDMCAIWLYP